MTKITYTFPVTCPIPALRGVTCTGGVLSRRVIGGKVTEVVAFANKVAGNEVMAIVAGKPELEKAVAEIKAAEAKAVSDEQAALEAAVPGVTAYEAAMKTYSNASAAYDRASGRGYPAREAAAAKAANETLQAVYLQYPATALWSKIIGYTQASNDSKASAGDAAKKAVLAGQDIAKAVEKMEADWLQAAEQAVWNS